MESEIELAVEKIQQLNTRTQKAMMELVRKSLKMNDDEFNKELLVAYAHQNPVHILEIAIALKYEEIIKALPEQYV
ncbi:MULTISPECIES: hypothetical protein [unclassified Paenibacillus]|jgi:fructose/tagatose bisphosphate aldolase|uniref:hypothetical protein n=1 Tax=unclassified Paenibacillus TaxID=185978 RepID=UPI00277EF8D5|nr:MULTISPECIES: hypothetical protein [unclassified Paenibacillus]MDF2651339.1 hypothetical protein [Paenibacillus sp.]MDQ0898872.1 fructose/tagatose bisphosphate aldolase [Paenibacillus sp. V4I7]MDQ0915141.1 fructose/tagatose bisphosphate aldolase [Paenibacillus sp. V4I5]